MEPNLTSVEQPTFEMGRNAAQLLLEQIKHNVNKRIKCCRSRLFWMQN